MSYNNIEASLQSVFQKLARFSDAQVTRGDDTIAEFMLDHLPASKDENCIVLYPGAFSLVEVSQNRRTWLWMVYADVYYRYQLDTGGPADSWTEFRALREEVIDELMKWPNLDQSTTQIDEVLIRSDQDPQEVYRRPLNQNSKPALISQRMVITVRETEDVTYG